MRAGEDRDDKVGRDLAAEFQFHKEQTIDELRRRGLDATEAEREFRRRFGDSDSWRARILRIHVPPSWSWNAMLILMGRTCARITHDLRQARRSVINKPAVSLIAVLTLALGIGASATMFSFADAVVFKALGFGQADRLVTVWERYPSDPRHLPSPPVFRAWQELNGVFSAMSAYGESTPINLAGEEHPEQINGRHVSANYFDLVGATAFLGRTFREGEDQLGHDRVAVVSNGFWRRRLGGDPGVIGSKVTMNDQPYSIVGVLRAGVFDRLGTDVWLPLAVEPRQMVMDVQFFTVRAKLKPGVTVEQANAALNGLSGSLAARGLAWDQGRVRVGATVEPLRDSVVGADVRSLLLLLLGAVLCVLLIAVVNVANVLVARGAARQREMGVRRAIGATAGRIVGQMVAESVLLAASAGAVGELGTAWAIRVVGRLVPAGTIPPEAVLGLDWRVTLFTAVASAGAAILVAAVTSWQALASDPTGALRDHVRTTARLRGAHSRSVLLTLEMALTVTLLIGATLMIRSFSALVGVNPGLETPRVLTFETTLSPARFPQASQIRDFDSSLRERIQALPGVEVVGVSNNLPLSDGGGIGTGVAIQRATGVVGTNPRTRLVSPDYFRTLGIRLAKGRLFSDGDTFASPPVAVINELMASRYWPGSNPLDGRIQFVWKPAWGGRTYAVVGVIHTVKNLGLAVDASEEVYVPLAQTPDTAFNDFFRSLRYAVRTTGEPTSLIKSIQDSAVAVDRDQPLADFKTMNRVLGESVQAPQFSRDLFSLFAAAALLLAVVGIYGVFSCVVSEHRREIGIRLALGSSQVAIFQLVMGWALGLIALGVMLGIGGAVAGTRLLRGLLFAISPVQPGMYAAVACLFIAVAVAACSVPTRRAMRVDPLVALRDDV